MHPYPRRRETAGGATALRELFPTSKLIRSLPSAARGMAATRAGRGGQHQTG